jgi:hypothetical protein
MPVLVTPPERKQRPAPVAGWSKKSIKKSRRPKRHDKGYLSRWPLLHLGGTKIVRILPMCYLSPVWGLEVNPEVSKSGMK